jgi:hypothetical protein
LEKHTRNEKWYFDASMHGGKMDMRFSSLQAYWPWLQVLAGNIGEVRGVGQDKRAV